MLSPLVGSLFVYICRENVDRSQGTGITSDPIYCDPLASQPSPQYLPFDFQYPLLSRALAGEWRDRERLGEVFKRRAEEQHVFPREQGDE